MKIQTFSIVCGTSACNARCPFCVSKMTVENGVTNQAVDVNWRNFDIAASLARDSGCATAMITSKGEPTLFPDLVDRYVTRCAIAGFHLIELQTNGIPVWDHRTDWWDGGKAGESRLEFWYLQGMTTVSISVVHHDPEVNRKNYVPYRKEYIDLPGLIALLHGVGFSTRLAVVGIKGAIDNWEGLVEMVDFAREHRVSQLTWRPVNVPKVVAQNDAVAAWQVKNAVLPENQWRIENRLMTDAAPLLSNPHGMRVFDVDGQNLAITNCLTQPVGSDVRQLIVFPDGKVTFDWVYSGARIL